MTPRRGRAFTWNFFGTYRIEVPHPQLCHSMAEHRLPVIGAGARTITWFWALAEGARLPATEPF
jgi:hypothetical protein